MALTLDQLRVLDAIDRAGSFAGAAATLHRTTSAVSYGIKTLEEALGLTLFDRSGHRAVLTPAGRLVLDAGRGLLDRSRELSELARALRGEWEPSLKVVADGISPLRPLMRAMRKLEDAGVPTRVGLRLEYLEGVRERFEERNADVMLSLTFAGDARHVAEPLPPIEMVLLAGASHPLRKVKPLDRAALAEHVELVVEDSSRDRDARSRPLSLGCPQVFRLSDFRSKLEALLEGVGVGWMPRHLVADHLKRKRLVVLPFAEGNRHVFVPHLVHRRGQPLGRAGRMFVELLRAELEKPARRAR